MDRLERRRRRWRIWQLLCVLEANDGLCVYCYNRRSEVMDHVIPFAQGGADNLSNLVPACAECNNRKSNRTPVEWCIQWLMSDNWNGNGTVHGGANRGDISLRDIYLEAHADALGMLELVEEVLAEIADRKRQRWFRRYTSTDYPNVYFSVDYYRANYANRIKEGREHSWR